ncbi:MULTISPECIES: oxygenase MpaB family protein [Tsukamurella]|uniref:oxygenase MpaB family protein n=1 Tax=Tsukamurella TaxID=2060 RepID=UPI002DD424E4|nr:oxygenase MpaB family protein [Tsukamurella tyrosinosolvens]MEC4616368.1 oxygenase MpaB family protein [Tsukamurella tyrosinosolvens]
MANDPQYRSAVAPLGPDSATWLYFGDWRGMLIGPWSGSMQNMHPKLGAAVWEHSDFFGERWQRLYRSLYPIIGTVFDEDPETTGRQVRDFHRDIKGELPDGARYHALDPDVFYWAHATFWYGNIRCAEEFGPKITEDEKRALFEESREWYSRYGVSMRPVPETYEDFLAYWDRMCREVLVDHAAARQVLDLTTLPPLPGLRWIPQPVWAALMRPGRALAMWITVGMYDQTIRDKLGFRWTRPDAIGFRAFGVLVRGVMTALPPRYRLHPRARDAFDRVHGRVPQGAPALESPRRNLPPPSERDDPRHYCPVHAERRAEMPWRSNERKRSEEGWNDPRAR